MKENEWTVFVDESFMLKRQGFDQNHLITAYFAMPESKNPDLLLKFKKKLYKEDIRHEKKSNRMSDQRIKDCLSVLNRKGAVFVVAKESLPIYQCDYAEMKLLNRFHGYFFPIRELLLALVSRSEASFLVNFRFDNESTLKKHKDRALFIISGLVREISELKQRQIQFTFSFQNSKKSLGVQIADFICGAYRREVIYESYDQKEAIIPFPYSLIDNSENQNEDELAQLLGKLILFSDKFYKGRNDSLDSSENNILNGYSEFQKAVIELLELDLITCTESLSFEEARPVCEMILNIFQYLQPKFSFLNLLCCNIKGIKNCRKIIKGFVVNLEKLALMENKAQYNFVEVKLLMEELISLIKCPVMAEE